MDDYKQKYRQYLAKVLEGADPADASAIEAGYGRLRAANERMLETNPRFAETGRDQQLRDAIEEVIREHAESLQQADVVDGDDHDAVSQPAPAPLPSTPATVVAPPPAKSSSRAGVAIGFGFLMGIVACGVIMALTTFSGLVDISTGDVAARKAALEADYEKWRPQVEPAVAYLRKIEAEVKRRQAADPQAVNKLAGDSFIQLTRFDQKLADEMPKDFPRGANVILRANTEAYKILFSWHLCRPVSMVRPTLVDPKRAVDNLNCGAFGVWNPAGASF